MDMHNKTIQNEFLSRAYILCDIMYIRTSHRWSSAQRPFCSILWTHWGRVTHICVGKLTTIGSDNGLSPGRRQAIIWTNDRILLIGPLGTNFSEILIAIETFSLQENAFENIVCEMASILSRPQCVKRTDATEKVAKKSCVVTSSRFLHYSF